MLRVVGEQLVGDEGAAGTAGDDVGEGPAAVDPETASRWFRQSLHPPGCSMERRSLRPMIDHALSPDSRWRSPFLRPREPHAHHFRGQGRPHRGAGQATAAAPPRAGAGADEEGALTPPRAASVMESIGCCAGGCHLSTPRICRGGTIEARKGNLAVRAAASWPAARRSPPLPSAPRALCSGFVTHRPEPFDERSRSGDHVDRRRTARLPSRTGSPPPRRCASSMATTSPTTAPPLPTSSSSPRAPGRWRKS